VEGRVGDLHAGRVQRDQVLRAAAEHFGQQRAGLIGRRAIGEGGELIAIQEALAPRECKQLLLLDWRKGAKEFVPGRGSRAGLRARSGTGGRGRCTYRSWGGLGDTS